MLVIAGLGNPGPEYALHRHNVGFMACDAIVARHGFGPGRVRFDGIVHEGRLGETRAIALKPATWMNDSGRSVGAALRFYKLDPERLIVIHDELDLPAGRMKVKRGGGNAGHNGLRSIDAAIGPDYWRVRIGIGHPGERERVIGYALHDFSKSDRVWLGPLLEAIADHVGFMAEGRESEFMNRVTRATRPPEPEPKPATKPAPKPAPAPKES